MRDFQFFNTFSTHACWSLIISHPQKVIVLASVLVTNEIIKSIPSTMTPFVRSNGSSFKRLCQSCSLSSKFFNVKLEWVELQLKGEVDVVPAKRIIVIYDTFHIRGT